ncbi:MAG: hypothetical protein IJ485_04225 [Lachnospiraceae bacterium]|nr:hypothetical protein [Lachnospiraceae bacterium]
MYIKYCCDMIAMKREVAASKMAGFPWSECQKAERFSLRKLTTSHCTNYNVCRRAETTCKSASKAR